MSRSIGKRLKLMRANQGLSQLGEYGAGKLQEQFKNWFSPATPNANPEA